MQEVEICTGFNVYSDATGSDPDRTSPTLKRYHKTLWSKPLPGGQRFELDDSRRGAYLYHTSELGEFFLGSDAITNSYKTHKRKYWLTKQKANAVNELFDAGSTIGAYIIFPNKQIGRKNTINQARGWCALIDDRFDLTLECIRCFYLGEKTPLFDTLSRYRNFFDLFDNFLGYVRFFLLDDLIDENGKVKFYLPFDGFKTTPTFSDSGKYLQYKEGAMNFIKARNERINHFCENNGIPYCRTEYVTGIAIPR